METFSVISAGERLPDFSVTALILADSRSLNTDDASRQARHAWGVFGEKLSEQQAEAIVACSKKLNTTTLKIPTSLLPVIAEPEPITKGIFEEGNFVYAGPSAAAGYLGKDEIIVLAAAPVKIETSTTVKTTEGPSGAEKAMRIGIMAVTGLPIGLGKTKETTKVVKSSETSFCLDLVLKENNRRLRIDSDHFDFSCLKDKKTYSSQVNFRVLCTELAKFFPSAFKNSGLYAILESKQLSLFPCDTKEDLEKEISRLTAAKLA